MSDDPRHGHSVYEPSEFLGAEPTEVIPESEVSLAQRFLNVRTIGSLLFALLILFLFFRVVLDIDFAATWALIQDANPALLLAALSWIAFVVTLVRYPQAEGDPVKASYMLYLVPLFALALVRAASTLWRRHKLWRIAIAAWVTLYAASFVGYLLTSW